MDALAQIIGLWLVLMLVAYAGYHYGRTHVVCKAQDFYNNLQHNYDIARNQIDRLAKVIANQEEELKSRNDSLAFVRQQHSISIIEGIKLRDQIDKALAKRKA